MVSGEPEHGFERDVPVEAPIVSEDKLVEIGADVLAAQPMIGAEPPALHQHSLSDRALATQCPLALAADRQRTAPLYYILTNLGQRDELCGQRYDRVQSKCGVRRSINADEKNLDSALPSGASASQLTSLISSGVRTNTTTGWSFQGKPYHFGTTSNWKISLKGLDLLAKADRVEARNTTVADVRFIDDFAAYPISNVWTD